ncbi:hypothetical protein ACSNOB_07840 [Micromonospora sp. URMC 106]|uniref:hypothetical protein n=1 Tax=Micromonospora sp. URMC 106 TaxID=3423408 RepID=UPI003F1DCE3E
MRQGAELPPPKAGDVIHLTRAASVQFIQPIMFRVIRVLDWATYYHWIWLDGYQLDRKGDAVSRRSVFVQKNGLLQIDAPGGPARRTQPSIQVAGSATIRATSRPHVRQHRSSRPTAAPEAAQIQSHPR